MGQVQINIRTENWHSHANYQISAVVGSLVFGLQPASIDRMQIAAIVEKFIPRLHIYYF